MTIHRARNVIKVTLGFLELAFALKFLSVADLAYGWRLLDRETFIHPPDFGIDFSQDGNRAKSVNGNAKAMANPNIPIAGATTLPVVDTWTSKKPIIGPVQEKDTNESVKAIRKILSNPVVDSALLSTAFPHFDGSLISNAPKNEAAKITSIRKKRMLKIALVDKAFNALAPKIKVIAKPNAT